VSLYTVVGDEAAEERFGLSADVDTSYRSQKRPIRLYGGGLRLPGDLAASPSVGRPCADHVIVDGDLVIGGQLDWWQDDGPPMFLLVTGDLRARSVHVGERVSLVVRGDMLVTAGLYARSIGEGPLDGDSSLTARDLRAGHVVAVGHVDITVRGGLEVAGAVLCRDMDDRGSLSVAARTSARELVTTHEFSLTVDGPTDPGRSAEISLADLAGLDEVIRPELLVGADSAGEAFELLEAAVASGQPLLRDKPGPLAVAGAREVERLFAQAAQVTELNLGHHLALSQNPEGVLRFTALRKLSLAWQPAAQGLLARLAELPHLQELDISWMELAGLPEKLARIGDLTGLRVLRACGLSWPLPEGLARLRALEELDLSWLQPAPSGRLDGKPRLIPFPLLVTRLPALRVLSLSAAGLDSVPDDLLDATALEELNLNSALGYVESLPGLSRLPRLRTLRMNGRAGNSGRHPAPHLLDAVWGITTLEELGLDCWGEETRHGSHGSVWVRAPLVLPDDAFARMPRLRVLDLEFTRPARLPESFYDLTGLEEVDVDFSSLDRPTRQRLATLARTEPDNPARDWIRATQAHLLLKAGRQPDAYQLAGQVLARRPGFGGLETIAASAGYRAWRKASAR
jgi:hypothetical protein